jgi:NADH-quinone oxidoreductase subunit G
MCSRCVRFTREISGTAELQVINRGDHSEIDVFPGEPLDNKLAGNVVDLCPVGALGDKDFLYKQRVWYLNSQPSVCPRCSTGCSIYADVNKDVLFRLRPRENHRAQGWFMCDEGRYGFHHVNSKERLSRPLVRKEGKLSPASWPRAIEELRAGIVEFAKRRGDSVWVVISPYLTCEEAYLAAKWGKSLDADVNLVMGYVPVVGANDTYPKDRRGNPVQPTKFTIRAEKCPNRRGVEEILKYLQGNVIYFEHLVEAAKAEVARAVLLTAGYPEPSWLSNPAADALDHVALLATIDLFAGPATERAKIILPGSTWVEKDGTYVNHSGLAQNIKRCVRPPHEVRAEGQMFFDLFGKRGLMRAEDVRGLLAAEVPFFAPLADGVGEFGVKLG